MNWTALNFDWNQVRAFLATAEEGSFSAAARALKQTQPTLGRQVAALEESLGVVLFERVGRSLTLTPTGRNLLEHVRTMGSAAERLSLLASGQSQTVEGKVSISASDGFAANVLPPILVKLRTMAPGIEVEVVASDKISDLQRREADIAIRHVRPEEPELIARFIRDERARFYAATAYLDRVGRPRTAEDFARLDFFGFADPEGMLAYMKQRGLDIPRERVRLSCASGLVMWEMAKAGLGVCPMADFVGEPTPGMELVLPEFEITFPVWLAVHRELHTSRRIRLVFDLLAAELGR
ncbi:MAG: LysR family transcriptional regulator [Pseudomonadota bacterium]